MAETYISGIRVVYGNTQPDPSTAVDEINNSGNNINQDFGGEAVWLAAEFTTDPNNACNRLEVVVQKESDSSCDNLARGAGGYAIYIIPLANPADDSKIKNVALLRSTSSVASPPAGYTGMTANINIERGKTFLYVLWNSVQVVSDATPSQYVSGLFVISAPLASQKPRGSVTELGNADDDINNIYGSDYMWLVPMWSPDHRTACTGFRLVIQETRDALLQDLAQGGAHRYLLPFVDPGNSMKITNVRLLRSNEALYSPPPGYHGMSANINKDRKGARKYLYLVWQVWEQPLEQQFVYSVNVVYGTMSSQEPRKAVTDICGGSDDINQGFDGSCVWLATCFTPDIKSACTDFALAVQREGDEGYRDLNNGAGEGEFRYLLPISDAATPHKITGIRLYRSSSLVYGPPEGYAGISRDLNCDRQKEHLYLIWQTIYAPEMTFVSGIDVVYGDKPSQEPRGAVRELYGHGDNINDGFGGSNVWIVPTYDTNARNACTHFQIAIMDNPDDRSNLKDLAKGAGGGQYRYVVPIVNPKMSEKVSNVRLLRSTESLLSPPEGFDQISPNINEGRQGSYLYLIWQRMTAVQWNGGPNPGCFSLPPRSTVSISCLANLDKPLRFLVDVSGRPTVTFSGSGFSTNMKTSDGQESAAIPASDNGRKVLVRAQHSNDGGRSYVDSRLSLGHVAGNTEGALETTAFASGCNDGTSYSNAYLVAVSFLPNPSIPTTDVPSLDKRSSNELTLHAKAFLARKGNPYDDFGGEIYVYFNMDYKIALKDWFTQGGVVSQNVIPGAKAVAQLYEVGGFWNKVCIRVELRGSMAPGLENVVLSLTTTLSYFIWKPTGYKSCSWTATLTGAPDYELTRIQL